MNQLNFLLISYCNLLDQLISSSDKIRHYASTQDTDQLILGLDNRDRLFKVLNEFQSITENLLKSLTENELEEMSDIIGRWECDTNRAMAQVDMINIEIVSILEESKHQTQKKMAEIYTNRVKLNGYNLKSLR